MSLHFDQEGDLFISRIDQVVDFIIIEVIDRLVLVSCVRNNANVQKLLHPLIIAIHAFAPSDRVALIFS